MSSTALQYSDLGCDDAVRAHDGNFHRFAPLGLTFILYLAGSFVGFILQLPAPSHSGHVSVLWPPNAVLVSLMLILPAARWPSIILAAAPAHLIAQGLHGTPLWLMGVQFGHNCFVAAAISGIVRNIYGGKSFAFDSLGKTITFLLVGVAIVPALGALIPAFGRILILGGSPSEFRGIWRAVTLSDALSIGVLTPLLVSFSSKFLSGAAPVPLKPRRMLELAALLGGLATAVFVVFNLFQWDHPVRMPAMAYLPLPMLIWAALRFSPTGVSLSTLLVAVLCIRGTLLGVGPFAISTASEDASAIQCFLLVLYLPELCLAVVARERVSVISTALAREAEAREQFAQLSNIYRNAPIGLSFVDTRLIYRGVNEFLAQAHGLSAREHIGRSLDEVLVPEVAAVKIALCRKVMETGKEDVNREISGPVGMNSREQRNWLVSHYPVRDSSGIIGVNVILQDITNRKRAEAEILDGQVALHASLDRIQDLAGRLIQVQEQERTRIARELHDDVNQQLAALSMAISSLKRRLPADTEVRRELDAVQKRAIGLTDEVRNLCHGLHSGVLQHAGLTPALRAYCAELQGKLGVVTSFAVDENVGEVPANISLCLYRVAQEAMTNVLRHAHATRTDVKLGANDEGIELSVSDDGRGFNVSDAAARRGLGLISIDERVRMVRGKVTIVSRPKMGTTVRVWVPRK